MTHKDFSEKKMENVINQRNEWFAGFKESSQFMGLTTSAQANSDIVTMALSEWMYKEELRAGREWTGATLENILVNIFPREVSEYLEVKADISSILTNYFTFLKEDKKITNGDTLLRKLAKLDLSGTEVTETKDKIANEGEKSTKKNHKQAAYSAHDISRFNRFAMGNQINEITEVKEETAKVADLKTKVGRNDDCPCGSGKKYKKCHGK